MDLVLLVLAQAGCLLVLVATAWAAGWAAWGRRSPERLLHPLTPAIGLALLGEVGLLLAALHLFTPWALVLVAVVVHAAAASGWRLLFAHAGAVAREQPRRAPAAAALTVGAGAGSFAIALFPPTAFDETTYHLPFAHAFLAQPGLPWVPELRVAAFPLLGEALQAALLAMGGERAPHQLALLATLATAALLVAWGREADDPIAGWLGAAVFLGNPLVAYLAGTGYVDPLLGLFTTGAFYSLWRARHGGAGWAATAGLLAGAAASVKYLGLYAIGAGALALVFLRPPRRHRLAAFGAAALLSTLVSYGYLIVRTGNPLFPFFSRLFGTSRWEPTFPGVPAGERPSILMLPFNSVFRRELAGDQPPLSPALLLGSLLLLVAFLRVPRLRPGAAIVAGFFPAYLEIPVVSRYLLTVLPLWALLVGAAASWAWQWLRRTELRRTELRDGTPPRRLAAALAVALALPGPAYGVYYLWQREVPVSAAERRAYLAEVHPGYLALTRLQERRGGRYVALCLACEHLHAFARGRLLGEHFGPWGYWRLRPLLAHPAALERKLRAERAGYLLLPRVEAAPLRRPEAAGRFRLLHADADFELWALAPPMRAPRTAPPPPAATRQPPSATPHPTAAASRVRAQ